MRKGGITEFAIGDLVNLFQACALSGHSTGNTSESYTEKTNIACALKAVKAHSGYKNVNRPSKVPMLKAIWANDNSIQEPVMNFVDKMFMVSVPAFKVRRGLRTVLEICAASLIQYHPKVTQDCRTTNIISSTLSELAREVRLSDVRCANRSPEYVLRYWSKLIIEDLKSRTIESFTATPDLISTAATMNQVVTMLATMQSQVNVLSASQGASDVAVASQESEIVQLHQRELVYLEESTKTEKENNKLKLEIQGMKKFVRRAEATLQEFTSFHSPTGLSGTKRLYETAFDATHAAGSTREGGKRSLLFGLPTNDQDHLLLTTTTTTTTTTTNAADENPSPLSTTVTNDESTNDESLLGASSFNRQASSSPTFGPPRAVGPPPYQGWS